MPPWRQAAGKSERLQSYLTSRPQWRSSPVGSRAAERDASSYDQKGRQLRDQPREPLIANDRNYYKVEKWTKDGSKVERMLYAGSNLDKAREIFTAAIYHRPRIRLTIRQRSHVLEEWPKAVR